ncbi:CRISPR-associated endonuclease Cas1, partial [Aporhodopirellula aestuarii]
YFRTSPMRRFLFRQRPDNNVTQVPQVAVGVTHLCGAGRLHKRGNHFEFQTESGRQLRIDAGDLNEIIAYDEVTLTTSAMQLASDSGITVSWMTPGGAYLRGRLSVDQTERSLMRLMQYAAWEDRTWQTLTARQVVSEKLQTVVSATRHYQRQGRTVCKGDLGKIESAIRQCESADVAALRGIEGSAAAAWYQRVGIWLPNEWKFSGRNRRPPKDPVNALLSLGYMHLYRRTVARIEAAGYEASLGALHEFRPGRMSMACDLMEPLRIPVVDRFVLGMISRRMVQISDFETRKPTGCRLSSEKLPQVLGRLEEHWHQNFFVQHLDHALQRWSEGLRSRVSESTSRAAAYLKKRATRAARELDDGPYAP